MEQKMTRREAREHAFLAAFAASFDDTDLEATLDTLEEDGGCKLDSFGKQLIHSYYEHMAEVNDLIAARLKGWTINRVPRVSITVLRLALAEILYGEEKLLGVVINEAVELSKKYGAADDYQFVNGVLGAVVRDLGLAEEQPAQE